MTARSPSTSTCSTVNRMAGSAAKPCQPARHSSYPAHRLPSGAGPVPSITQSGPMRSTSFSGARWRNAALYWSMTAAVSRTARRMSQLDLALRAGTTQRHVSFIEQGRSRPGRGMVLRLAESMELTLRQRNELLLAAGFAPAFPESPLDDAALRPVRHALDTILDGH